MASVLVVFESTYGQTSKIAEHVGETTRRRGHAARVLHVDAARGLDLEQYDGFFVVAPVYGGHHTRSIVSFVKSFAPLLSAKKSAFISVSNSAASAVPEARATAQHVAQTFIDHTAWKPDFVLTAGGAFAYPRYNWLLRHFMKFMARRTGGPTDTRRTHELTNWATLDADLYRVLSLLDRESAPAADADAAIDHAAQ